MNDILITNNLNYQDLSVVKFGEVIEKLPEEDRLYLYNMYFANIKKETTNINDKGGKEMDIKLLEELDNEENVAYNSREVREITCSDDSEKLIGKFREAEKEYRDLIEELNRREEQECVDFGLGRKYPVGPWCGKENPQIELPELPDIFGKRELKDLEEGFGREKKSKNKWLKIGYGAIFSSIFLTSILASADYIAGKSFEPGIISYTAVGLGSLFLAGMIGCEEVP